MKPGSRHLAATSLTLILALALTSLAAAQNSPGTFVDDDDSVHEADIEWIAQVGITRGCNPPANDRYCPEDPVTRGQMAAFLTRALDLAPSSLTFTDTTGHIFESDIASLAAADITRGCNPPANDRYCPEDPVTRGQMASFLRRALEEQPPGDTTTTGYPTSSTSLPDSTSTTLTTTTTVVVPPSEDAEWHPIPPAGEAVVKRHENGFVAVGDDFYLIGGRRQKPLQRFSTATGKWSNTEVATEHFHHFQPVTVNGLVYILGAMEGTCCTESESPIPNIKIFDPDTNTLTDGDEIPADRRRGAAGAALHGEYIYLAGGVRHGHGVPDSNVLWFDRYHVPTGTWEELTDIPLERKRDHFQAVVWNDKLYLVAGRRTEESDFFAPSAQVAAIDVYDLAEQKWLDSPTDLPEPRAASMNVALGGAIYVIGGEGSDQAYDRVDRLDLTTMTWDQLPPIPVPRHGTGAAVCDDDIFIAAGSEDQGGDLAYETNVFHGLDTRGDGLNCLP